MNIGIGGAGSKLAALSSDGDCTIVNVSELELNKVEAKNKLLAVTHSSRGQFQGAGKNPNVGKEAFISISDELKTLIRGNSVFSSTGGGTGNGISSLLLEHLYTQDYVSQIDRTMFMFLLPYLCKEGAEYIENTIDFLGGPLSNAIDTGNTGNIILFSNKLKFEARVTERAYNKMLVDSLNTFLAIPVKGEMYDLLDGHIDFEDFNIYKSKPYFNHFCHFNLNPEREFDKELANNFNGLLLPPEQPIETMFLLEVPKPELATKMYDIIDYFSRDKVLTTYGVIHNPELKEPYITVSLLYSRKPKELVSDFEKASESYTRNRIKKSLDQHVVIKEHKLDQLNEARKIVESSESSNTDILDMLKRLGKL